MTFTLSGPLGHVQPEASFNTLPFYCRPLIWCLQDPEGRLRLILIVGRGEKLRVLQAASIGLKIASESMDSTARSCSPPL